LESVGREVLGEGEGKKKRDVVVGMIGYPNVGKSSTVNVLMGEKRVSVSATPGKTKHFQTLNVRKGLTLCDCPGLVFPTFMKTKASLVASGVFPIAQLRHYAEAVGEVISRVTRGQIQKLYGLSFPMHKAVTAEALMDAHATMRGFMKDHGRPDASRSARVILQDFVNGRGLVYCHPPPNISPMDLRKFLVSIQGLDPTAPASVRDNSTYRQQPRGKEVWGITPDNKELFPDRKEGDGGSDEKDMYVKKAPGVSAIEPQAHQQQHAPQRQQATTSPTVHIPLPAGMSRATHADGTFLEDGGIMDGIAGELGGGATASRKPNTNKKMSKRERRRLRKLNKMENTLRRDIVHGKKSGLPSKPTVKAIPTDL